MLTRLAIELLLLLLLLLNEGCGLEDRALEESEGRGRGERQTEGRSRITADGCFRALVSILCIKDIGPSEKQAAQCPRSSGGERELL
ncbi:hypothetical protein DNTS_017881 [Danionella cerebrum]|uniref:Uncharacterized protein n=1 Tax=Danionella cerebrum TaxID=2873325 RepID=A0A553N249_9TELE|nr:hypothetical protein DNTS_017881 [Danionella translucida]